jgi:hypothetical protein
MSDLETRLRDGLHADVAQPEIERFLTGVRRRAAWRRGRRASAAVAVVIVALLGGSVFLQQSRYHGVPPEPDTSPSPTTTGAGPHSHVVGLSTAGSSVFRLTSDLGCTACSTVWLRDASGGWTHLYDFEGRRAYDGPVHPSYGPVDSFTMAADGQDGWAWGQRLWATHDGGHTWSIVSTGPGPHTSYGQNVSVGTHVAWATRRTAGGDTLWRTTIGSDHWQRVTDVPRLHDVVGFVGTLTDDRVAIQVSGEGGSSSALVIGTPGSWTQVPMPSAAETLVHLIGTDFWASIPEPRGKFRLLRLSHGSWVDLGKVTGRGWLPLDGHRALVDRSTAVVLGDGGTTTATDLRPGGRLFEMSRTSDGTFWLLALGNTFYSSADGLHWTTQP